MKETQQNRQFKNKIKIIKAKKIYKNELNDHSNIKKHTRDNLTDFISKFYIKKKDEKDHFVIQNKIFFMKIT